MQPKKTKYKKNHKPRKIPNQSTKLQSLGSKSYLRLVAIESSHLTGRQLEATRQVIRRKLRRRGRLEIAVYPDLPITNKPTAARMGKGKGKISHWVARIDAGKPVFVLTGISFNEGLPALKSGAAKLPIKLKVYLD